MSSTNCVAHDNIYNDLDLPGITAADGIKKNNDGYDDDVDIYAREMVNDIYEAKNTMTRLATGAQKWANLWDVIT